MRAGAGSMIGRWLWLSGIAWVAAQAQAPDVAEIMARVGVNQVKAQEARAAYVYSQKQLLRMRRGNSALAREERREYLVTPANRNSPRELAKFEGKYEYHGRYVSYDHPGYKYKDLDIDGDLIDDMSNDMMSDKDSRDGIGRDLFPLTEKEQRKYDFRLVGTETYRGRAVHRVAFQPKARHDSDEDGADWKGEALIDAEEYQPVLVTTSLASKIPMAVKILLGTDNKGLGFSLTYQRVDGGVWFPASYGGEFEVRGLFLYKRKISVSMVNTDFHKTDVKSTVLYKMDGR
jgi:hypothetical protein